jgi:predicted ABC-type transport system involved in lysophospholipase L1 biosynthesis ATPase subunit
VLVEDTDLGTLSRARVAALRRRRIGYVFQDFNLIPALTAAENVALPRELDGISARKARKHALHALEEVGIHELADRFPDDMSGAALLVAAPDELQKLTGPLTAKERETLRSGGVLVPDAGALTADGTR